MALGQAVARGIIANQTLAYFIGRTWTFFQRVGINPARMRFRPHLQPEVRRGWLLRRGGGACMLCACGSGSTPQHAGRGWCWGQLHALPMGMADVGTHSLARPAMASQEETRRGALHLPPAADGPLCRGLLGR